MDTPDYLAPDDPRVLRALQWERITIVRGGGTDYMMDFCSRQCATAWFATWGERDAVDPDDEPVLRMNRLRATK